MNPLKPGNVVVIDTDFLYKVGDPNVRWTIFGERQERRWKREKRLEKQKLREEGKGEIDEK